MKTKGNRKSTKLTYRANSRSNKPPPAPPVSTSLTECCFCKCPEDSELGKWYQNEENNIAAHQFCLLFSSGLPQSGNDQDGFEGFLFPDIMKELRRVRRSVCRFCLRFGASSGCFVKSCPFTYHFKCGLENDAQYDFHGTFNTFCYAHRTFQDMSYLLNCSNMPCCPICLESVAGNTQLILKMPCCKNVFAHKACIQSQANASGYFFLCPTCKNEKQFKREMAKFGIHIPMKDASWEENNAFSDLLQQYKSCDLPTCLCPMGQHFEGEDDSKWELIRCYHCGQGAIHRQCLGERFVAKYGYTCRDCDQVTGLLKGFTFSPQKSKEQSLEQKRLVEEHIAKGDSLRISHLLSSEKFCKVYDVKPCHVEIIQMPENFLSNWLEISEWNRRAREDDDDDDDDVTLGTEILHGGTMVATGDSSMISTESASPTMSKIKIPKKRRGRSSGAFGSYRSRRKRLKVGGSEAVAEVTAVLEPSEEERGKVCKVVSDMENIEQDKDNNMTENILEKIDDDINKRKGDGVNNGSKVMREGKENLITAWISTMLKQSKTSDLPINVEYDATTTTTTTITTLSNKNENYDTTMKSKLSSSKVKNDVIINTCQQNPDNEVGSNLNSILVNKEKNAPTIPHNILETKKLDVKKTKQNLSKQIIDENESPIKSNAMNFEAVALQKMVQTKYQSRKKKRNGQRGNGHKTFSEVTSESGYYNNEGAVPNLIQSNSHNSECESYASNSLDIQVKVPVNRSGNYLEEKNECQSNVDDEGKSEKDPRLKITHFLGKRSNVVDKSSNSNRSRKKKKKITGRNTFMDSWLQRAQTNSESITDSDSKKSLNNNCSDTHGTSTIIERAEIHDGTSMCTGTQSNKQCAGIGYDERGNSVNIKIEDLSDDDLPLLELRKQLNHTKRFISGPLIDIT